MEWWVGLDCIDGMLEGECEELRPFPFYSCDEFEEVQLISHSKYPVVCVVHCETKLQFILKQIPYSDTTLAILRRLHALKSDHLPTIHGACLCLKRTGWKADPRRLKRNSRDEKEYRFMMLFMEKYEGNLHSHVLARKRQLRPFSHKEVAGFIQQMLGLLEMLQQEGLSHRDVKPENILVAKDRFLLCDFEDMTEVYEGYQPDVEVTTLEYSSPEFLRLMREPKDKYMDPFKLDVYALGLTLLFVCSMGRFLPEERVEYSYTRGTGHFDFIEEQRKRYVTHNPEYRAYSGLVRTMLEEDEYKRDDFVMLRLRGEGAVRAGGECLSEDNSTGRSSGHLHERKEKKQAKQERRKRKEAAERRERKQEGKVYGWLSLAAACLFAVLCLL